MRLFLLIFFLVSCASSYAQFLPDNKSLNVQSVERWMKSAEAMAPVAELMDSMLASDEEIVKFDQLPELEQDQKIQQFLIKQNQWEVANALAKKWGWKSLGEFRRLSTKLGNAIAAYFSKKDMEGLNEDQVNQLKTKLDPVILAVPESDVVFVQQHEKQLQAYIQAYGK